MSLHLPLLVLTTLALPLVAQTVKSESGLTLRLLAAEVPEGQEQVILQSADSKSAPVDLPTATLSKPIEVSARSLVLKPVGNDEPLATITLPSAGKSFAVLLCPEKPAGFTSFVVRTDDPAFKAGDVFLINGTTKTLAVKLGGTELVLDAGKASTSRPTQPVDGAYFEIDIHTREDTGDKPVTSSRWPVDTHLRSYVFFSTNARGKINYRAVDEFVEPVSGKRAR
jgi:hypothetical protein